MLKLPADTAIRGRSSVPVSAAAFAAVKATALRRGERPAPATADDASSHAASPLSTALRETFDRSSPSHAAWQCGGRRSRLADIRASGG